MLSYPQYIYVSNMIINMKIILNFHEIKIGKSININHAIEDIFQRTYFISTYNRGILTAYFYIIYIISITITFCAHAQIPIQMEKQQQIQVNTFVLSIQSLTISVKFPCKMYLEFLGQVLTPEISYNSELSKYVFNQQITIQWQIELGSFEIVAHLKSEKNAKYLGGIIRLDPNQLIRQEGQIIQVDLVKAIDSNAKCELRVDQISNDQIFRKTNIDLERMLLKSNNKMRYNNPLIPHKDQEDQKRQTLINNNDPAPHNNRTRSQAQYSLNHKMILNQDEDRQDRYTSVNKNRYLHGKNQNDHNRNHNYRYNILNTDNPNKLIDSQLYKQSYNRIKQKYRRESQLVKTEQNRRLALENNQNTFKLEIMRLKMRLDQSQRNLQDKSAKLKDIQEKMLQLHQKQIIIPHLQEQIKSKQDTIHLLENTIEGLNNQMRQLRQLENNNIGQVSQKYLLVRKQLEDMKKRLEEQIEQIQRKYNKSQQENNKLQLELKFKTQRVQREQEVIEELESNAHSRLLQFENKLRDQNNQFTSSQSALEKQLSQVQNLLKESASRIKQFIKQGQEKTHKINDLQKLSHGLQENSKILEEKFTTASIQLKQQKKINQQIQNNLKKQQQEFNALKNKSKQLKKQIEELKNINTNIQRQLASSTERFSSKILDLQTKLSIKVKEVETLTKQNKEYSSAVGKLQNQFQAIKIQSENKINHLKGQNERLREEKQQFNKNLNEIKQNNIQQLVKEQNMHKQQAKRSRQTEQKLYNEINKYKEALQQAKQQNSKKSQQKQFSSFKNQQLITKYQQNIENFKKQIAKKQSHIANIQEKLQGTTNFNVTIQKQLQQKQIQIATLENQIQTIQQKHKKSVDNLIISEKKIQDVLQQGKERERILKIQNKSLLEQNHKSKIQFEKISKNILQLQQRHKEQLLKIEQDNQKKLNQQYQQKLNISNNYDNLNNQLTKISEELFKTQNIYNGFEQRQTLTRHYLNELVEQLSEGFNSIASYHNTESLLANPKQRTRVMSNASGKNRSRQSIDLKDDYDKTKKYSEQNQLTKKIIDKHNFFPWIQPNKSLINSLQINTSDPITQLLPRIKQSLNTLIVSSNQQITSFQNVAIQKHKQIEKANQIIEQHQQNKKNLNEENMKLKKDLKITEDSQGKKEKKQSEQYKRLNNQIEILEEESDYMKEELQQNRFVIENINRQIAHKDQLLRNTQQESKIKEQKIKENHQKIYNQLLQKHQNSSKEYNKLNRQKTEVEHKNALNQYKIEELSKQLQRINHQNQEVQNHRNKLRDDSTSYAIINQKLSAQIQMFQRELKNEGNQNQQNKKIIDQLLKQKTIKVKDIIQLNNKVSDLERTIQNNSYSTKQMQSTIHKLSELLKKQKDNFTSKIYEQQQKFSEQRERINKYNQELITKMKSLIQTRNIEMRTSEDKVLQQKNRLLLEVKQKETKILQIQDTLQKKANKLQELQILLCSEKQKYQSAVDENYKQKKKLEDLEEELVGIFTQKQKKVKKLEGQNHTIRFKQQEIKKLTEQIRSYQEELRTRDNSIEKLTVQIYQLERFVLRKQEQYSCSIEELKEDLEAQNLKVERQFNQQLKVCERQRDYYKIQVFELQQDHKTQLNQWKYTQESDQKLIKLLEQKSQDHEKERNKTLVQKNTQIKKINIDNKNLFDTLKSKEFIILKLEKQLQAAKTIIDALEAFKKETQQKIRSINKFYQIELENLKKKRESVSKNYKQIFNKLHWDLERQVKASMDQFMSRTTIKMNSHNASDQKSKEFIIQASQVQDDLLNILNRKLNKKKKINSEMSSQSGIIPN